MTINLMTTNKRVQFFLTYTTDKPATALKQKRLALLEKALERRNIMLDELFPIKQLKVLDYILYITSGAGICKVGAEHIAKKCDVSVTTVYNAVRALKQTDEFIIARLVKSGGGAGKYVFVDKKHANFNEIMREVFGFSDSKIAELFVEQSFAEQPDVSRLESNNQSSNIDIYLKHELSNKYISISHDTKEAVQGEVEKSNDNSIDFINTYASNPYQIALYEFISNMPYSNKVFSKRAVIGLRVGSDCDFNRFVIAKKVIHSIAMRIAEGFVFENVVAVFSKALAESVKRGKLEERVILSEVKPGLSDERVTPVVPFYNWLTQRE